MHQFSSLAFEEYFLISCWLYVMFMLGMLRRWTAIQHAVHSPLGRRRMRGAQPTAPDVIEKSQCDSKLRCWVQQLMHIVHPAIVCKRYVHSIPFEIQPKSIQNQWKIEPRPVRIHPDSTLQHQIDDTSTRELQKSIFKWFWGCILEVKMWRKSPHLNESPNCISIACLHADFTNFSVIWGPQNVPKIKTFSKFV